MPVRAPVAAPSPVPAVPAANRAVNPVNASNPPVNAVNPLNPGLLNELFAQRQALQDLERRVSQLKTGGNGASAQDVNALLGFPSALYGPSFPAAPSQPSARAQPAQFPSQPAQSALRDRRPPQRPADAIGIGGLGEGPAAGLSSRLGGRARQTPRAAARVAPSAQVPSAPLAAPGQEPQRPFASLAINGAFINTFHSRLHALLFSFANFATIIS